MAHSLEWTNASKTKVISVDLAIISAKMYKLTTYYTINTLQSMIKSKMSLDSMIHSRSSNIWRITTFHSIARLLILDVGQVFLGLSCRMLGTKISWALMGLSKCLRCVNRKTFTKASTNASSAANRPSHQSTSQLTTSLWVLLAW